MASPAALIGSSPRDRCVHLLDLPRYAGGARGTGEADRGTSCARSALSSRGGTWCDGDFAMYVAFHSPMFGTAHVDSHPLECPFCARGKEKGQNDWEERNINVCNPGDVYTCLQCGRSVTINWGLVEPDHLSNWVNSEYCPHRLCKIKYQELCLERGWPDAASPPPV
jgi:hypothetical protein